jgi:NAD(P)-dependent dehydrogenase (short-subunit alcohol dehydrogenase family)
MPAADPRPDRAVLASALTASAFVVGAGWRLARRRRWSLAGRTVIVTGGARGLGLALAREFGAAGARLVLLARTESELIRAQQDLRNRGVSTDVYTCDVASPVAVTGTIERIARDIGRIDVLVNNAGVIQMMPFEHATDADFKASLDTHFWGPLHLVRACLPRMPADGRIVNISSIGGRVAVPHLLPYSVGKFALSALSDGLQAELAKRGIRVTTVTPNLMRTGSHRNVVVRGQHRAEAQWFAVAGATSLTSMQVQRAARQIVAACSAGRPRLTPGWQARTLELANVLVPNAVARIMAAVAGKALPGASSDGSGSRARWSRDLDLGWLTVLFPTGAAAEFNQPIALGERTR